MFEFKYTHDKENFQIRTKTPYNKNFVEKARNLRGKWDREVEEWVFDDNIEDYIKKALLECYGTTGEGVVETCNLLIKEQTLDQKWGSVELFGRSIARAFGRNSGAELCNGIIWLSGEYKSGGSMKNWYTEIEDGTFEIQEFPIERTKFEDVQTAIKEGWCEIKTPKKKRTKEEIESEIKKYEKILEELKTELNCYE